MADFDMRACAPQEAPAWEKFLNRCFGYEDGQSFAIDFAPLFEDKALASSRLLWNDGKIIASATMHETTVVTPHLRLHLGIIGAVATDPEHRGKGHSRRLIIELEALARLGNFDGLILWSDQLDHYKKLGFTPVGKQQIFPLESLSEPAMMVPGSVAVGWDWNQVETFYDQHSAHVVRSRSYWEALKKIRSCNKVQWVDRQGKVHAYLAFNRGRDMYGIIHEWGGELPALHCLLWETLRARPKLMLLAHPKLASPITRVLSPNTTPIDGHLALLKPLKDTVTPRQFDFVWFWGLDSL